MTPASTEALWQDGCMLDERLLALIDTNRQLLVRAASRLLGPMDAEDAVQDAYVRALESEARELQTAQAWLLTVVRNLSIDRLRRRQWLQQWVTDIGNSPTTPATVSSAESDVALAQETTRTLRLLAARLTPADGALLLLHEVFEADHAEIAQAGGKTETGSRQQLRRALLRLRQAGPAPETPPELEPGAEAVFRVYVQSLRLRDPQALWAMLRQPPISARTTTTSAQPTAPFAVESVPQTTLGGVVQVGGQLGLVLTLDGVTLCVLPLGARAEREPATA